MDYLLLHNIRDFFPGLHRRSENRDNLAKLKKIFTQNFGKIKKAASKKDKANIHKFLQKFDDAIDSSYDRRFLEYPPIIRPIRTFSQSIAQKRGSKSHEKSAKWCVFKRAEEGRP